jgi:hypothetical protein
MGEAERAVAMPNLHVHPIQSPPNHGARRITVRRSSNEQQKIDGTWTTDRCRAQIAAHAQSQRSGSPRPPGDVTAAASARAARVLSHYGARVSPSPTASFSCGRHCPAASPPDSSVSPPVRAERAPHPSPRRIVQGGLLSCEVGSGGRHRCLLLPADRPPPIPSRSFLQRSFEHATPAGHSRHAREATGPVSQPKEWLAAAVPPSGITEP